MTTCSILTIEQAAEFLGIGHLAQYVSSMTDKKH